LNNQPNFLDKRTLAAIALVFVTWMGWQYYMQQKYPEMFAKKNAAPEQTQAVAPSPEVPKDLAAKPAPTVAPGSSTISESGVVAESVTPFKAPNLTFEISSKGMGIKNLRLLECQNEIHCTNRRGEIVEFSLANPPRSFETRMLGGTGSIDFKIEKVSDTMFVGHGHVGGVEITKSIQVDPEKFSLNIQVSTTGSDPKFVGLSNFLSDDVVIEKGSTSFLNRNQFDRQEAYVDTSDSHKNHLYFSTDVIDKTWPQGHVIGLGSQYFIQALVDHSPLMPDVKFHMDPTKKTAIFELQYSPANKAQPISIQYTAFAGPKSLSLLKSVDEDFVNLIDFGMFSFIARYILAMLKGFYSLVHNWGLSIILLTLLVRLLVMPFNIMSYKSMKAMQALQPKMADLRLRYKDDQAKLNQEMMLLLKTNKVNPLGGCLPVLLQFPIFLALYQVLGHSIELYQQPFIPGWITDLSLKDPFYILPVLMGFTMFMQQRITPNTLDPAQAKILMFMPLMFAAFMLSLPSGLTLYIFVSALFAVVQQFYFMKSHGPAAVKG
jgi:YidC/Oxa1 family membrane protein insertase